METPPDIGAPSSELPAEAVEATGAGAAAGVLVGVTDTGVTDTGVTEAWTMAGCTYCSSFTGATANFSGATTGAEVVVGAGAGVEELGGP